MPPRAGSFNPQVSPYGAPPLVGLDDCYTGPTATLWTSPFFVPPAFTTRARSDADTPRYTPPRVDDMGYAGPRPLMITRLWQMGIRLNNARALGVPGSNHQLRLRPFVIVPMRKGLQSISLALQQPKMTNDGLAFPAVVNSLVGK